MVSRQTSKATRAQAVCSELEEEIVSGALAPGTRLDETTLAARFNISRTPVREALQLLVSKALAIRQPYRGVVVAEISRERLDQLFEAMAEIEATCGRIAAQRMTTWERAALTKLNGQLAQASQERSKKNYESLNESFHELIYQGTHNETLYDMARSVRLQLSPYRRFQFRDPARIERSHREHQAIVDAIVLRDPVGAETQMRKHLMSAAEASLTAINFAADIAGSEQQRGKELAR